MARGANLAANGACGAPGRTPLVICMPLLRYGRALTQRTEYFPSDSWDQNMSKQQTNNQETNQGPSDAPQASEHENPLPEASEAEGDGPVKVEPVDPVEKEGDSSNMEVDEAKEDKKQDADEEKPKFHTCGSQRKRFRWFISQGYEYEDASELAKDAQKYRELRAAAEGRSLTVSEREFQLAQQRKALNRIAKRKYTQLREHGYSEEEAVALAPTLVDDPGSRQKHLKSDESKRSGDAVKMVIVMHDYPRTVLTEDQAKLVKDAILKLVVSETTAKTKPHFAGCKFTKGYLIFDCLDQQTITWIQYRARELQLWEGCTLKAISLKALQNSDMFTLKLADSEQETDEEIKNFLNKQNDGIDSNKWIFAERKLDAPSKTLQLTIKIDPISAKTLHQRNYTLNYKFEQVKLNRITIDLADAAADSKPSSPQQKPQTSQPSTGNRRGGRGGGGYAAPQRRPYRGGFRGHNRPQMMGFGNFNGGGDYIDGLLDQLNRSLYASQQQQQFQSSSYNYGAGDGGGPYGRGRGGGGRGGYRNFNSRQRYF